MEWLSANWPMIMGWIITVLLPALWGLYQQKGKLEAKDVIGIIVGEVQKHSKATGDKSLKEGIAATNSATVNMHVAESKDKLATTQ